MSPCTGGFIGLVMLFNFFYPFIFFQLRLASELGCSGLACDLVAPPQPRCPSSAKSWRWQPCGLKSPLSGESCG